MITVAQSTLVKKDETNARHGDLTALRDAFPETARPGSSGVEQRTENPRVGGSNPPPGTRTKVNINKFKHLWPKSVPLFRSLAKSGTLLF